MAHRRDGAVILPAVLLLAGCSESREAPRVCEPDAPAEAAADRPEVQRCAPRGPDEWAAASAEAPAWLPERIEVSIDGRVGRAVALAGPPVLRRYTYRIGLTDGSVTPVGFEAIGRAYFDERVAALSADPGLDELLVCETLPGGGELRLVPSRTVDDPPEAPEKLRGWPYEGALRRRGPDGEPVLDYTLWVPETASDLGGHVCGEKAVLFEPDGPLRMQCDLDAGCLSRCMDSAEDPWLCTGRAPDGLVFCEPPGE